MKGRPALCSICLLGFAISPLCKNSLGGQTTPRTTSVRVRLVDYRTGRPLGGHKVWLSLSDGDGQLTGRSLTNKTEKGGLATFQLEKPLPKKIWVTLARLGDWNCNARQDFDTQEVISKGIPDTYSPDPALCKGSSFPFADPPPGEIVIPVRRLNFWLMLRRVMEE